MPSVVKERGLITTSNCNSALAAGLALKHYIKMNYSSQQAFADDFGADLRTVNRYVTTGINYMSTIEEVANFFQIDYMEFLKLGKELLERGQQSK